jgi:hypothetical protein
MALTGSFTYQVYTNQSESVERIITYPADLPSSHLDYEKRGTTETITEEVTVTEDQTIEGAYVAIKTANIWKTVESNLDPEKLMLTSNYRVYGSEASRSADVNNYIIELDAVVKAWDWDIDTNPYSATYDYIKSLPDNNLENC